MKPDYLLMVRMAFAVVEGFKAETGSNCVGECAVCCRLFPAKRRRRRWCSNACRQKAYKLRRKGLQ